MAVLLDPRPRSRRERATDEDTADRLAWAWREATIGAGVARVVATASGPTDVTPRVESVRLGPPTELVVRLLPGQLPDDLRRAAYRLAPALGAAALRITPRGYSHVRVRLLDADPLDRAVPRPAPVASALDPLVLGVDEGGQTVTLALDTAAHLIVQGASGSGKSVGCYALLAQLAAAPDVIVAGSDVSGLLLAPWADHPRAAGLLALGTHDPAAHLEVLERLVVEMDRRIAAIPPGRDAAPLGSDTPVLLAVVEELPGLLRLCDGHDKMAGKRVRAALARLLAEGRKAGVRCLLVTQRADASIVGGYERGQASHTISFRIDSPAGLAMLHPEVPADLAAAHATAPPGIALVSAPGAPLTRFRAPLMIYAAYCAAVSGGVTPA